MKARSTSSASSGAPPETTARSDAGVVALADSSGGQREDPLEHHRDADQRRRRGGASIASSAASASKRRRSTTGAPSTARGRVRCGEPEAVEERGADQIGSPARSGMFSRSVVTGPSIARRDGRARGAPCGAPVVPEVRITSRLGLGGDGRVSRRGAGGEPRRASAPARARRRARRQSRGRRRSPQRSKRRPELLVVDDRGRGRSRSSTCASCGPGKSVLSSSRSAPRREPASDRLDEAAVVAAHDRQAAPRPDAVLRCEAGGDRARRAVELAEVRSRRARRRSPGARARARRSTARPASPARSRVRSGPGDRRQARPGGTGASTPAPRERPQPCAPAGDRSAGRDPRSDRRLRSPSRPAIESASRRRGCRRSSRDEQAASWRPTGSGAAVVATSATGRPTTGRSTRGRRDDRAADRPRRLLGRLTGDVAGRSASARSCGCGSAPCRPTSPSTPSAAQLRRRAAQPDVEGALRRLVGRPARPRRRSAPRSSRR